MKTLTSTSSIIQTIGFWWITSICILETIQQLFYTFWSVITIDQNGLTMGKSWRQLKMICILNICSNFLNWFLIIEMMLTAVIPYLTAAYLLLIKCCMLQLLVWPQICQVHTSPDQNQHQLSQSFASTLPQASQNIWEKSRKYSMILIGFHTQQIVQNFTTWPCLPCLWR